MISTVTVVIHNGQLILQDETLVSLTMFQLGSSIIKERFQRSNRLLLEFKIYLSLHMLPTPVSSVSVQLE